MVPDLRPLVPLAGPAMNDQLILTVNAGSSSVKVDLFALDPGAPKRIADGEVTAVGGPHGRLRWRDPDRAPVERAFTGTHDEGVQALLELAAGKPSPRRLLAVGHRVAHGGAAHVGPELATTDLLRQLDEVASLAPLHVPHNLRAITAVAARHPDVLQVLCYDTAFHATLPPEARRFALPRELGDMGVVRYGFHGLSYEHVARVLPQLVGARADGRVVVAHLGAGASLCAMRGRRSVATTMGFSPLDGVPMATRCGSLDPGVVLHLLRQGMSVDEVEELLYHRSGLLGSSGISGDVRDLLASYRIRESIGALAADLGGLDAVVFTGGIGEHQPLIRAQVCAGLSWLGLEIDGSANLAGSRRIDRAGTAVAVLVVPADEAQVIADHTRDLVTREAHPGAGAG
jgi:acetate kinase